MAPAGIVAQGEIEIKPLQRRSRIESKIGQLIWRKIREIREVLS